MRKALRQFLWLKKIKSFNLTNQTSVRAMLFSLFYFQGHSQNQ